MDKMFFERLMIVAIDFCFDMRSFQTAIVHIYKEKGTWLMMKTVPTNAILSYFRKQLKSTNFTIISNNCQWQDL